MTGHFKNTTTSLDFKASPKHYPKQLLQRCYHDSQTCLTIKLLDQTQTNWESGQGFKNWEIKKTSLVRANLFYKGLVTEW